MKMGEEKEVPSMDVDMSTWLTGMSIRGRNRMTAQDF